MDKDLLGITVWELWKNFLLIYEHDEFVGIISVGDIDTAIKQNYEVREIFPTEIAMGIFQGKVLKLGDLND